MKLKLKQCTGSLWHKDKWLPCTERSYYGAPLCHKEPARTKQNTPLGVFCVPKPLVGGFGCDEPVLYGIRELAQQHLWTNESRALTFLDQWEWTRLVKRNDGGKKQWNNVKIILYKKPLNSLENFTIFSKRLMAICWREFDINGKKRCLKKRKKSLDKTCLI